MKPDIETHTSEPPNIEEQEKPINKVTHMEEKSMKKTWSVVLKVIIAVAGAIAGVLGVQAASL